MISGTSPSGKKRPSWLMPSVGYAISLACLIWVLKDVDFGQILHDLTKLHWGWVLLAVFADIMVYVYQAYRWNLLLRPVAKPPLGRSVKAIYVGLFANEVLPLRTGELIRCYLQGRWSKIPFSVALSSAMIERVFDGVWLILAFFAATFFVELPRAVVDIARILTIAIAVFALALGVVMFSKRHAHAVVCKTRWGCHLQVLVDDLHAMGNSPSFYKAAIASLPYLLIQVVPIWALMQGYPPLAHSPMGTAAVVLLILRLGTAIPQAPGNLGSFQALAVLALKLFDVDKTTATGFSFMMWGVITLPLLLAGFLALALTGINFGELRHNAQAQASLATTTPAPAETE